VDTGAVSGPVSHAPASETQRTLDEQREKYLRLAAEYDNFRKRTTKERLEAGSRAQADLVRQLIDSLDDLSRFATVDPAGTDAATVLQGVDLVEKKLRKALTAAGLEVIEPVDQPFDPAVQEAIATEPALSSEDDNMVARVYQRGYTFNGQLLRPARVVVKQWNG
jgi:molecular chaperone GrpE